MTEIYWWCFKPFRILNKYWTILRIVSPVDVCLARARKEANADTSRLSVLDINGSINRKIRFGDRISNNLRANSLESSLAV